MSVDRNTLPQEDKSIDTKLKLFRDDLEARCISGVYDCLQYFYQFRSLNSLKLDQVL